MDRLAAKYDGELDLNSRNSLKLINDRLRDNSKVLEFGPANGRLTRHMHCNRNCCVDIVEYNAVTGQDAARYARRAILGEVEGDIDKYVWVDKLANEKYDFIIFADVLEHLYDPVEVLKKCKDFLEEDGAILISVPNIANNNIILSLLKDEFEYTPIGLLDETHIRFFTYKSLFNIAEKLRYSVSYTDYTFGMVGQTEVETSYDEFSDKDLSIIDEHLFGSIYQLVFEFSKKEADNVKMNEVPAAYIPICYYGVNGIYGEDKRLECADIGYKNDVYRVKYHIERLNNNDIFRFDPTEGVPICLKMVNIYTDAENIKIKAANYIMKEEDRYYFLSTDPYVEICGDFSNATYLELEYKLNKLTFTEINEITEKKLSIINTAIKERVLDFEQKIDSLKSEINIKNQMIRDKDMELTAVKSSKIYRVLQSIKEIYRV